MILKFGPLFPILIFCFLSESKAQIDFQEVKDFNILWKYENIAVDWKMDGKSQLNLNEGINNLLENKPGIAVTNFDELLKTDPSSWVALYYRSVCNKLIGKFANAKSDLTDLMRKKNDLPQSYLELAKVMILLKDIKAASNCLQRCNDKFPNYLSVYYLRGDLYLSLNQIDSAKTQFRICEKLDGNFPLAKVKLGLIEITETKEGTSGLPYFNEALSMDSLQSEALWCRAMINYKSNLQSCLKDISTLVRNSPNNLLFVLQRGLVLSQLNNFDAAWKDFNKYITYAQIDQNHFDGRWRATTRRIDVQNAGYYLIRKLYDLSDSDQLIIKKTFCLMFTEKNQEAFEEINHPGEELEKTALWHYMFAIVNEHLYRNEAASEHYDKALNLDPEIFDAYKKRGIYRSSLNNWKGAEEDFSEMIKLQPGNKFGYKLRLGVRDNQKQFELAIEDAKKALLIDSTDCDLKTNLGFCLLATSKYLPAIDLFVDCGSHEGMQKASAIDKRLLHAYVLGVLAKGDTLKTLKYLTALTEYNHTYEQGTKLKIEILYHQKKWAELYVYIEGRNRAFGYFNTTEYGWYLDEKLSEVKRKLKRAQKKIN